MLKQCLYPLMGRVNVLNANNHRKLKFKIFIRWFYFDTLWAKPSDLPGKHCAQLVTKSSTKVCQNLVCFSLSV